MSFTTRSPIEILPSVISSSPRHHPQKGGLTAPRRTDQHHKLAVTHFDAYVGDRPRIVAIHLPDGFKCYACHCGYSRSQVIVILVFHYFRRSGQTSEDDTLERRQMNNSVDGSSVSKSCGHHDLALRFHLDGAVSEIQVHRRDLCISGAAVCEHI